MVAIATPTGSINLVTAPIIRIQILRSIMNPGSVDAPIIIDATANPDATLVPIVTVESPTLVIVEVGEGMEVGPGFDAQINIVTE